MKKIISAATIASLALGGISMVFGQTPADFALVPALLEISLRAGGPAQQVTVTAKSIEGFNEELFLFVPDLASYLRARFEPNPIVVPANGTADTVMTISADAGAPAGTVTITLTGQSASGLVRSASMMVTVFVPSLTVTASNMQLNTTPADGTNDKVAYSVTATGASGSVTATDFRTSGISIRLSTSAGTFYSLSIPAGGLSCTANTSGGQDCEINQAGRDASGLGGGSFKLFTSTDSLHDAIQLLLQDPKVSLLSQDYSNVRAEVDVNSDGSQDILDAVTLLSNSNQTVWKKQ